MPTPIVGHNFSATTHAAIACRQAHWVLGSSVALTSFSVNADSSHMAGATVFCAQARADLSAVGEFCKHATPAAALTTHANDDRVTFWPRSWHSDLQLLWQSSQAEWSERSFLLPSLQVQSHRLDRRSMGEADAQKKKDHHLLLKDRVRRSQLHNLTSGSGGKDSYKISSSSGAGGGASSSSSSTGSGGGVGGGVGSRADG